MRCHPGPDDGWSLVNIASSSTHCIYWFLLYFKLAFRRRATYKDEWGWRCTVNPFHGGAVMPKRLPLYQDEGARSVVVTVITRWAMKEASHATRTCLLAWSSLIRLLHRLTDEPSASHSPFNERLSRTGTRAVTAGISPDNRVVALSIYIRVDIPTSHQTMGYIRLEWISRSVEEAGLGRWSQATGCSGLVMYGGIWVTANQSRFCFHQCIVHSTCNMHAHWICTYQQWCISVEFVSPI